MSSGGFRLFGVAVFGLTLLGLAPVSGTAAPAPPVVSLMPGSGRPGDDVTISGSGFAPNRAVAVYVDGALFDQDETDRSGAFSDRQTIPRAASGPHTITVTVAGVSASTTLWILSGGSAPATATPTATPTSSTTNSGTYWIPPQMTEWQWQLTGTVDTTVNVALYDIDLFDNTASVVSTLHASGRHVFCYLDAGTWENWRPDASSFPSSVLGSSNGWPGERWLDIRNLSVLGPILQARLDLCRSKGFDGVEFDNIDGYTNSTGFPLSAQDQLTYNSWLADQAHRRNLSAGLKNDVDQVQALLPKFDWLLDEQCFQYNECGKLVPFVQAGKAVFEVEYSLSTSQFCPQATAMKFNAMKKNLALDAARTPCR